MPIPRLAWDKQPRCDISKLWAHLPNKQKPDKHTIQRRRERAAGDGAGAAVAADELIIRKAQ